MGFILSDSNAAPPSLSCWGSDTTRVHRPREKRPRDCATEEGLWEVDGVVVLEADLNRGSLVLLVRAELQMAGRWDANEGGKMLRGRTWNRDQQVREWQETLMPVMIKNVKRIRKVQPNEVFVALCT